MQLRILTSIASVAAVLIGTVTLGPTEAYRVDDASRFYIDGNATTGPFTCTSVTVEGDARLGPDRLGGKAMIPVDAFDCGISRMNRDLRTALQADRHPAIQFELQQARVLESGIQRGSNLPVQAVGTLTIAGTTRQVAIRAEGVQMADGRVRVHGSYPLLMSDFGVTPPSGLLGLVRANDQIVARFDIIASPR